LCKRREDESGKSREEQGRQVWVFGGKPLLKELCTKNSFIMCGVLGHSGDEASIVIIRERDERTALYRKGLVTLEGVVGYLAQLIYEISAY